MKNPAVTIISACILGIVAFVGILYLIAILT